MAEKGGDDKTQQKYRGMQKKLWVMVPRNDGLDWA